MREILFKAKRKDTGEWICWNAYGELCRKSGKRIRVSIRKGASTSYYDYIHQIVQLIDKDTICQYTGLTDKNGNMTWENDVAKGKYWERGNSHRHIGTIKYIGNAFKVVGVKQYEGYHDELNGSYERIGNIFDNKQLLTTSETTGQADNGGLMPAT